MPLLLTKSLKVLLAAILLLPVLALPANAEGVVQRAFGPDRIATAVDASASFRDRAQDALLTTAFSFPDALAAGALAHSLDAPLLLTPPDEVPQIVVDELSRLGVQTVWILGGHRAVSAEVEQRLRDVGFDIRRLAGASRYGTAQEIARAAGPSGTGEVVLALGEHGDPDRAWPDAVASGALAATPDQIPTVLTRPHALPSETEQALAELSATDIIILGGANAIAPAVEDRLIELGYGTRRIAGASRYDTSVALAREALDRFDLERQPAVFASGRAFPDALSAGSLAASLGAPLLLVPPTNKLPGSSEDFLRENTTRFSRGVIVGGPAAANDYVLAQLDAALQGEPTPARSNTEPAHTNSDPAVEESFSGQASWYGPGLDGNKTANGETFDQYAMTAAHRTLPFDSVLLVTNLNNGEQVQVRINDRGPFAEDRVLDVSAGAAEELDMKSDGVVTVRVDVLSYG